MDDLDRINANDALRAWIAQWRAEDRSRGERLCIFATTVAALLSFPDEEIRHIGLNMWIGVAPKGQRDGPFSMHDFPVTPAGTRICEMVRSLESELHDVHRLTQSLAQQDQALREACLRANLLIQPLDVDEGLLN